MHTFVKLMLSVVFITIGSIALAAPGPLILGGDDLDDHGSRNGAGVNIAGWAYAESAAQSILAQVSNTGTTIDIAAIGPTASASTSGNSGGMVGSVATNLGGLSVLYLDGQAAIQQFFTDLTAGTVKPKMIWIVSDGAANDLDTADENELALHGAELNNFQQSGGGILAQSHGYAWLISLLPGIVIDSTCLRPIALTAQGNASFPGLTNAQVDAGPCHNTFSGDLGGLVVLATESGNRNVIIGGASGVVITPTAVPTLSFWALLLMTSLFGIMGGIVRRKK